MQRGTLRDYNRKRDFSRTAEPRGEKRRSGKKLSYLIQKHEATRLHYDFRLEWDGKLMSWAIPKGPSENPTDKRLAVHVEDHPVDYGAFEGTIPEGEYGAGTVMIWDRGTWVPNQDVEEGLKNGKLSFQLHGKRLHGNWALVRLRRRNKNDKDNWLLIKELDEYVKHSGKLAVDSEVTSAASGRTMDEIAAGKKVWHSGKPARGATADRAGVLAKTTQRKKKVGGRLPAFISPQLATLVETPPPGPEWLHEIKLDGYRAIASVAGDRVTIRTRTGLDWTSRFAPLVAPLTALDCDSALLDGEVTVTGPDGRTDFGALQEALSDHKQPLDYYVFDLLELNGEDIRDLPLSERKERLATLLGSAAGNGPLRYSSHVAGSGDKVFAEACKLQLEGIVSKRADAPYRSGRGTTWLKCKCALDQEFVIIGWQPSDKPGRPFASILIATRDNGDLRYCGGVGSGYSGQRLKNLAAEFKRLERRGSPAKAVPAAIARHAHFIEPKLVAQIAFRGWTKDGMVRQGAFKGLRGDKPASEVVRERAMPKRQALQDAKAELKKAKPAAPAAKRTANSGDTDEFEGVRVTHPDRELYAGEGITKRDVIAHYLSVADLILPHLASRPTSIVRCPDGTGAACFFQKHASPGFPDEFKSVRIAEKSGKQPYLYIEDERGLIAAVQMGALELHIWGCHVDSVEKPDRMVFDFDPDEGLPFSAAREAAREMRDRLQELGLQSFPMATGGKGIHVVVPLAANHSWDDHRDFAEAMARAMTADAPDRFVATMAKRKRNGKIFIDYLRNTRGATAIAPFSTRARRGAHVAVPVSWPQLSRLQSAHPAAVGDMGRFAKKDAWEGYFRLKQTLPLAKLRRGKQGAS